MSEQAPAAGARPGDVLLFHAGGSDPISRIISTITQSPYSHSAIALGDGAYAHANVEDEGRADVLPFDDRLLVAVSPHRQVDLYRAPAACFSVPAMARRVDDLVIRANAPNDTRVVFSDGALAGLAMLRLVASGWTLPLGHGTRQRLKWALVTALDDTDRRLFCSEFVYRVSVSGGYVPELPADPFIPADVVPDEDEIGAERTFLDRLKDRLLQWLFSVGFDEDSLRTFDEAWEAVVEAYGKGRKPADAERANFFVPRDFATSAAYSKVATWAGMEWGLPKP